MSHVTETFNRVACPADAAIAFKSSEGILGGNLTI